MYGVFDVAQIRAAESAAMRGTDDTALMMRAATGLAVEVARELRGMTGHVSGRRVLILAGAGNNGGDALFAGAWLAARGVSVVWSAVLSTHHRSGAQALSAAGGRKVSLDAVPGLLGDVDIVLDGVLGIGGRPGLPASLVEVSAALAQHRTPVIAVDLPSGLTADAATADPGTHLDSRVTVTFGARKLCQVLQPAAATCGDLRFVDIGLDMSGPKLRCWEPGDVAALWPVPGPRSDKYSRGVVGVDAGSSDYPGAGLLATTGATYAGAGMVRYLGDEQVGRFVVAHLPNIVVAPGRVQAAVLGPGWGKHPNGLGAVTGWLSGTDVPVLIDADGLRYLPRGHLGARTLLTPHAGELARLLSCDRRTVETDPLAAVRAGVSQTGATVLLKGATQLVAGPDDEVIDVAVPGPAWTGQAGSGDVLSGVIGALLAAGLTPRHAAVAGASLQAMAATAHPGPRPPQDLAREFPDLIASLPEPREPLRSLRRSPS